MLCAYVQILIEEKAQVKNTPSIVFVSHLVDGDVVDSCFVVNQGKWRPWYTKPREWLQLDVAIIENLFN